jgi:hypothetical protein
MKDLKGLLKFSGSKNWYFRFFDTEGKRRTVTLGTDDLAVAIQKKRAILGGQLVATRQVVGARPTGMYKSLRTTSGSHKKEPRSPFAQRPRRYADTFSRAS